MTDTSPPSATPWSTITPVPAAARPSGDVTLVEGQTFCISDRRGDMVPTLPQGLFVLDARMLSMMSLRVNGHALEPLGVVLTEPFAATFATRAASIVARREADVVVFRRRHVSSGMRERITVTNHGTARAPIVLELLCDADFADVFEVKEGRVHRGKARHGVTRQGVVFDGTSGRSGRRSTLEFDSPASLEPGCGRWEIAVDPGESWQLCMQLTVDVSGEPITPRFRCDERDDASSLPEQRLASWRARLPSVSTDHHDLASSVASAGEDLGALRIFDPAHPDTPIIAAGAPWFMTVFGRDSLLTAWMTLIADPSLATGVLETLARFQGTDVNLVTEEEPGKILHEMRFGPTAELALGGGHVYYGSIDATPLFVMVLGELRRWGLADELVDRLLPHADAALHWIEHFGDRDGDGYVEYRRHAADGLANQGWKDSWDSIRFADGRLADPPIALCEVQGYVYAAYVARAHFAEELGDHARAQEYADKAATLRRRFNEDFWLDEQGTYALGLDAQKRPIDAVTSNPGHCLWTGIVDIDRAPLVAERLLQPDMFSGWGVRTLATSMAAYNPVSYHNGSVWPHDNAICAAGLTRYGLHEHARRVIEGQLAAAAAHDERLPELFAGFSMDELPVPGAYPASCSPQAWASASPLLWLRTLLGLAPCVPLKRVWVSPSLPRSIQHLSVEGIQFGPARLGVEVTRREVSVSCTDPGLDVVLEPRSPTSATVDGDPWGS